MTETIDMMGIKAAATLDLVGGPTPPRTPRLQNQANDLKGYNSAGPSWHLSYYGFG